MEKNVEVKKKSKEVVYTPSASDAKDQELISKKNHRNDTAFLYFSSVTALLIIFIYGSNLVWTSPVLPKLKDNDTNINPLGKPITTGQISLMVGLPALISMVIDIFMAKLPDILGRRETMKYMAIGMVLSNIAVAFGSHIFVYYVAKSFFFTFGGAAVTTVQIYMSEIAEDHNRGKFGCLTGIAIQLGNLFSFIVGPVTTVRVFTLLVTMPLAFTIVFFHTTIPESPVYLAMKGDKEETMKALRKLRNNKTNKEIEEDYLEIEDSLKSINESEKRGFLNLFDTPALRKAVMISMVANMTQHFSGIVVIMAFLGPMFTEAGTQLSGDTVAIIVGIVKVAVCFLTFYIIERLGRRPLLLFSSFSSGFPLFLLGLYFFWKKNNAEFIEDILILPIISILAYIVFYSVGLAPIPMAMIGELFPSDLRAVAATFIFTIVDIIVTVFIQLILHLHSTSG